MVPRRNEQRLGSAEAATSSWTRPLGLAGATDRRGHGCGPCDGSRLFAGRRDPGARSRAARRRGGKTGHFRRGVHRLPAGKSSHWWGGASSPSSGRSPGIDQQRRMSKDYERMCASGKALVYAAMIRLMTRSLRGGLPVFEDFSYSLVDGVLRSPSHLPPMWMAGRLVPSGSASLKTSWVTGAVSPSPKSRKRNR